MKTKKPRAMLDALVDQVGPDRAKWQAVHRENLRMHDLLDSQRERIRALEADAAALNATRGEA